MRWAGLNPSGPVYNSGWNSIVATFPEYVLVRRYDYDDDEGETFRELWRLEN